MLPAPQEPRQQPYCGTRTVQVLLLVTGMCQVPTTVNSAPAILTLNLTEAAIRVVPTSTGRLPVYAKLLSDRVFERSRSRWVLGDSLNSSSVICLEVEPGPAESYRLEASNQMVPGGPALRITGGDERGVLFGVGRLLRELNYTYNQRYGSGTHDGPTSNVELPLPVNISSSPDFSMRGHQLGYRPKTNAYDGWDGEQYERYIEDLALFGTNYLYYSRY